MITSFITHEDCALHDMGPWHPENPMRLNAIIEQLKLSGLMNQLMQYKARQVTEEQLHRVTLKPTFALCNLACQNMALLPLKMKLC